MTRHADGGSRSARAGDVRGAVALDAVDVVHRFGPADRPALDGVSLTVAAGSCVALVGESGSGKTTLLRCFNRMVTPLSGTVTVGGRNVREVPAELLRRQIGYVPQDGGLLPHWTVLRNVGLVPGLLRQADRAAAAEAALTLTGLEPREFGERFPHELSGGQRQRVALARAIAARPPAILLDEPFGALDAISRSDLQGVFERVRETTAVSSLLVTHDLAEAARLADRLVVMRAGRIEQQGAFDELRRSPATPYVSQLFERALAAVARLAIARV